MKIVSAVYSHPEYYPPTLNALKILSESFDEVYCVHRNVKSNDIQYPTNVYLFGSGKFKSIRNSEKSSFFWKIISFLKFTFSLYHTINKVKPKWILLYDPFPLLSYQLIKHIVKVRPKVWYHNHDLLEPSYLGKFSIGRLAYLNEKKNLKKVEIFTLPSDQRKEFYDFTRFKGKYFFLPNYPSLSKKKYAKLPKIDDTIKVIYQGQIGSGHGLKQLISFIANYSKYKIELDIIGVSQDLEFINELNCHILNLNLNDKVKILSPFPSYEDLLSFSAEHHVGIAIYEPINTQYKTVVTASNKIYEYIALGMSVILYDDKDTKTDLGKYNWAKFTNLSIQSFNEIFDDIKKNHTKYTKSSLSSFQQDLNFDNNFSPILKEITKC